MADFNWVKARSECSLTRVFAILQEVVDSDVKLVNALNRRGVSFYLHTEAHGKFAVVRKMESNGTRHETMVVFSFANSGITVAARDWNTPESKPMFSFVPGLNGEGKCLVKVAGEEEFIELWQVSYRALDDLFFGF